MKKLHKGLNINIVTLSAGLTCLCILLLSIGFSAFEANLSINDLNAIVRVKKDIRITEITTTNVTNNATSNYEDYNVSSITSSINLPNSDSKVTYNVVITNLGNAEMGILNIDGLPSNLEYSINNYNLKDKLCDNDDNTKCKLGAVTTLAITIGYTENGYDATNISHPIQLDFNFKRVYEITYNGFPNTSNLPTYMIEGDTKVITFNNTTTIPSSVSVTGATANYDSPNLTLSNITINNLYDSIEITKQYSITYSGFSGDTSSLISSIPASGGTIEFNSTTGIPSNITVIGATGNYDKTNHILTLSNITDDITITASNSDSGGGNGGTWEEPVEDTTTTIYNPENVPEGTTIFTNVDGAPKVTADENGNITHFEYTNTGSKGITIPSEGVDTGVLAFDGNDFVVTLKASFTFSNCASSICPIINLSEKQTSLNGVLIYEMGQQKSGSVYDGNGNKMGSPFNKLRFGKYVNNSPTGSVDYNILSMLSSTNGRYGYDSSVSPLTITIKLYSSGGVFTSEIYDSNDKLIAKPKSNTSFDFSSGGSELENITIELGKYVSNIDKEYSHTFNILEFSINKTVN